MSDSDNRGGGFHELEPANLVVIGDRKNQVAQFGGLLIDIVQDGKYKHKVRYVCVGTNGEEYEVTGNAALSRRISEKNIGQLIKIYFDGYGTSAEGQFKKIKVYNQERWETTEEQKKVFPRWHDFEQSKGAPKGSEAAPPSDEPAAGSTNF